MSAGIVIIGSGFAARQLVKNIRKTDTTTPLTLIASDSMDEYNKPDLSHVISLGSAPEISPASRRGISPSSSTCACFPTRG